MKAKVHGWFKANWHKIGISKRELKVNANDIIDNTINHIIGISKRELKVSFLAPEPRYPHDNIRISKRELKDLNQMDYILIRDAYGISKRELKDPISKNLFYPL